MRDINYLAELEGLGLKSKPYKGKENEILLSCLFHSDETESLAFNTESGTFHCWSCEAKGNFFQLAAKVLKKDVGDVYVYYGKKYGIDEEQGPINPEVIEEYHQNLLLHGPLLKELEKRCVRLEMISRYRLGENKGRIQIPILNANKDCMNIRSYMPGAEERKFLNMKNRGKPRLFPLDQLSFDKIVITAGEVKALALIPFLNPLGIGAISVAHSGEGKWDASFNELVKGKVIYILLDVDEAGRKRTKKLSIYLYPFSEELYPIYWEFPENLKEKYPKGGIDDYLHEGLKVETLLGSAEAFQHEVVKELGFEEPIPLTIKEAFNPKHVGKRVKVDLTVTGVDETPSFVPKTVTVSCGRDAGGCCAFCPVVISKCEEDYEKTIHPESIGYLELTDCSTKQQFGILKSELRIPAKCNKCSVSVSEYEVSEELRISPILKLEDTSSDYGHQPAVILGKRLEANASYSAVGRMYPHPKTQRATFIISAVEAKSDDLTDWSCTQLEQMKAAFQPEEWTVDSIEEKLREIYDFLSCSVTKIYDRFTLHLFVDLVMHSALFINFEDEVEKGWVEGLVIGDSSQGKSYCIDRMRKFYNLGDSVVGKTSTSAGLIGGLKKLDGGGKLFLAWGAFPRSDKKYLAFHEVKGAPTDVLASLTEMRSTGIAQITKVETKSTFARVRSTWDSNARSDRPLASYGFGVDAAKELLGAPEDLRRFDIVLILKTMEDYDSNPQKPEKEFDRELFRDAILFAWTRKPNQVHFEDEKYLREATATLLEGYVEYGMPILDKGSSKLKVARLATALAMRTMSLLNDDVVLVRNCHVDYVIKFLDEIYSHPMAGYKEYSKAVKMTHTVINPDEIKAEILMQKYPLSLVENLQMSNFVESVDLQDWGDMDDDEARVFMGKLARARAIVRKSGSGRRAGYVKTPGFVELLKSIDKKELEKAYRENKNEPEF